MSDRKDADEREDAKREAEEGEGEERGGEEREGEDDDAEEADPEATRRDLPAARRLARERSGKGSSGKPGAAAAAPSAASRVAPFAILALLLGAAGGWFGHDAQAKSKLQAAAAAPAPSGSAGPGGACGSWQNKLCSGAGEKSEACRNAKGAAQLLTSVSCETELSVLPATLSKLKAARGVCDKLVTKLCGDLEPGSAGCQLVKDQTPSFPVKRCEELMEHYDEVIGELKRMEQQQAGMGGPGGPGMGAPMRPPGGAAPHSPDDGHGH